MIRTIRNNQFRKGFLMRLKMDTILVNKFRNTLMPPGSAFCLYKKQTINHIFAVNLCKECFLINFCGEHASGVSVIAHTFATKTFRLLQDICSLIYKHIYIKKEKRKKTSFLGIFFILGLKLWLG